MGPLRQRLSWLIASAACAIGIMSSAHAVVSGRFDGVYRGSVDLANERSYGACDEINLTVIDIRDGALRAYDRNGFQIVKALVTDKGFLWGAFYFSDGAEAPIEGMISADGRLTAGITHGGCAWVVDLAR